VTSNANKIDLILYYSNIFVAFAESNQIGRKKMGWTRSDCRNYL